MALAEALYALLSQNGGVVALAGGRIYPLSAPQSVVTPYVVYQRISAVRLRTLDGPEGRSMPRMQIDAYATTWLAARALADAIRQALDGFDGTVTIGNDSPPETERIRAASLQTDRDFIETDVDPKLYRVSSDYFVVHTED
jgi:hypothetical protein